MARTAKSHIGAAIRREVIRRVREGEPPASVESDLISRNANLNRNEIRSAARQGLSDRTTTERLRRLTQRTIGPIAQLMGCPPGSTARIAMRINYVDDRTGEQREFAYFADLPDSPAQVRTHLARATRIIITYALGLESIRRGLQNAVDNQQYTSTIISATCL